MNITSCNPNEYNNINTIPSFYNIDNRCLKLSYSDVGVFWREIDKFLKSDSTWTHLKIGQTEIGREKVALIAKLRLQIPIEHLPEIAKMEDNELQSLGRRNVSKIARAVYLGEYEIVKEMLEYVSDASITASLPELYSLKNVSLLDIAIHKEHNDLVALLLSYWPTQEELNINVPTSLLTSKSHLLALLIPHGLVSTLTRKDAFRLSPLHYAAMDGDVKTLRLWIHAGANVNERGIAGSPLTPPFTPLDYAIRCEKIDAALFLMEGIRIAPDCPILALAVKLGESVEFIRHLISRGANPIACHNGGTPLSYAINKNDDRLLHLIASSLPNPSYYIHELLEDWVKRGYYRTPHAEGISKAINYLIESLCPATANSHFNGIPLLHHVMLCCDETLALKLLEKGADPNTTTSSGISALSLALIRNYQQLAKELVDKGAVLDARDYAGNSPVWLAIQNRSTLKIAQQFLSHIIKMPPSLTYCCYKKLKITWLNRTIENFLADDPLIHERWKEQYLVTICAHLFDVKGDAILTATQGHMPPLIFPREGMNGAYKFIGKIGNFVRKLEGVWPQHLRSSVYSLCRFASDDSTLSDKDYLERIKANEPTVILSHSWMHSWNALFYDNYMVISNFDGTVQFYRYDKSHLSEQMIASLRQTTTFSPQEEVDGLLLKLQQTLKAIQDQSCIELSKKMTWSPQVIANCSWKSIEGVIGALLVLKGEPYGLTPFVQSLQLHFANRYISRHETGLSLFSPDECLISHMVASLKINPLTHQIPNLVQRGKRFIKNHRPNPAPYKNPMEAHPMNQYMGRAVNLPQLLHYPGRSSRVPSLYASKIP